MGNEEGSRDADQTRLIAAANRSSSTRGRVSSIVLVVCVLQALGIVTAPRVRARTSRCLAAKLMAMGTRESNDLGCVAGVVAASAPGTATACRARVDARFNRASTRTGDCGGTVGACDAAADACVAAIQQVLPDPGPSACEAAKLRAAGHQAQRALRCYASAAARGVPVDATCLARAESKLLRAVAKAAKRIDCSGQGAEVAAQVDAACVAAVVDAAAGVVTAVCAGHTLSTTTTTLPSSAAAPSVSLSGCATSGYAAPVTIGSQTFDLVADSGSTTLAVASTACRTADCAVLSPLYSPGATATRVGTTTSATYGDGSHWFGRIFTDLVSPAGIPATVRMAFSTIDAEQGFFVPAACSFVPVPDTSQGILGLGSASLAAAGTDSYLDDLPAGSPLGEAVAVRLCGSGGRLWLGGYDPASAGASPAYTPMVSGSPYYAVVLADLRVGGNSLGFGAAAFGPTLVDTGTTALVLPDPVFSALASAVAAVPAFADNFGGAAWFGGSSCDVPDQGLTKAQLDAALPPLTLVFSASGGPFTVDLPATDSYLLQQDDTGGTAYYCSGIERAGSSRTPTIIGANALHTLLTIFDRRNARVGFAPGEGCAPSSALARSVEQTPSPRSRPKPQYRRHP